MTDSIYSIDSSALIHGWHRAYRPRNFAAFWTQVDQLATAGRLKSSIEVYNELQKKDDELFKWCNERKDRMFVKIDDALQAHLVRIMTGYPRLVDTAKNRSGADPFVIALAATTNPKMVVVTEEKVGKTRIPDVCNAEKIDWCDLADLIEREDWKF